MTQKRVQAVVEGEELVIRIKMNPRPEPSTSGKTLVVASSYGNVETDVEIQGQPLIVGVNAYIRRR